MRRVFLMVLLAAFPSLCVATAHDVPGDFETISEALDTATSGDTIVVASGVYTEWGMELKDGVHLIGETGNPSDVVVSGGYLGRVFSGSNLGGSTSIEALTIANGYALSSEGAGLYLTNSSPLLHNLVFRDNIAEGDGGAIYLNAHDNDCSPNIHDSVFMNNESFDHGGAIYMRAYSSGSPTLCEPVLSNVMFIENAAGLSGGGIYALALDVDYDYGPIYATCSPQLIGSSFHQNVANVDGGAFCGFSTTSDSHTYCKALLEPSFDNISATLNTAGRNGGAVCLETSDYHASCHPSFSDVTLVENVSLTGIGGGLLVDVKGDPTMFNFNGGLIARNQALEEGGGVYIAGEPGSTIEFMGITVVGNITASN